MVRRGITRALSAAVLLALLAVSCKSASSEVKAASYIDDVARRLEMSETSAAALLDTASSRAEMSEQAVASVAVREADLITPAQARLQSVIDGLRARVEASDVDYGDVVVSALCNQLIETWQTGSAPTGEAVYHELLTEWGTEWANALWRVGWVGYVVDLVEQLHSDDPSDVSVLLTQLRYCP